MRKEKEKRSKYFFINSNEKRREGKKYIFVSSMVVPVSS
jgi:hypothetical protein